MKYPKDAEFRYFRILGTCNKPKGEPHLECMKTYRKNTYPWIVPPNPRGGAVACHLWLNGRVFATGISLCSMSDNFNYRTGREIAYGRALKEAKERIKADRLREAGITGADVAGSFEGWHTDEETGFWVHERAGGKTIHPEISITP